MVRPRVSVLATEQQDVNRQHSELLLGAAEKDVPHSQISVSAPLLTSWSHEVVKSCGVQGWAKAYGAAACRPSSSTKTFVSAFICDVCARSWAVRARRESVRLAAPPL